jgi:hypothetical protein
LFVIQLLGDLRRSPPGIGVDEEDAIRQRVDDEGLERVNVIVPDKAQYKTQQLEAQPVLLLTTDKQLNIVCARNIAISQLGAKQHPEDGVPIVALHSLAVSPALPNAKEDHLNGTDRLVRRRGSLEELEGKRGKAS